jgi:hypothetical protein
LRPRAKPAAAFTGPGRAIAKAPWSLSL